MRQTKVGSCELETLSVVRGSPKLRQTPVLLWKDR